MSWFEFIVVVFAMMLVHHFGYRRGFKAGALKQKMRSWQRLARAQRRVEAKIEASVRKMEDGDNWPDSLPDSRKEDLSC